MSLRITELALPNLKSSDPVGNRIEALNRLSELLFRDVGSLEKTAALKNAPNAEAAINLPEHFRRQVIVSFRPKF